MPSVSAHIRKDVDNTEQGTGKAVSVSIITVLAYMTESLNVLFFIMIFMLVIDYVTGLMAGIAENNLSSRKGIIGILKKLGYILLVFTAFLIDLTLIHLTQKIGLTIPVDSVFGVLVMGWLITNEGISVLENLTRSGVNVPMFLKKALKIYQDRIEDIGDNATKSDTKEDEQND